MKKDLKRNAEKMMKRRRLLHLPAVLLLAAVFSFTGMSGSLPFTDGGTGVCETFAVIKPEMRDTVVKVDDFFLSYRQSTKEPVSLSWEVHASGGGSITDQLGDDHCIFILAGEIYDCKNAGDHYYLSDNVILSEPGEYEYTIRFRGDMNKGWRSSEYTGTLEVMNKKDLVVTVSIPDTVPTGMPLPLSGTLTDEDGNPMKGFRMGLWVTGNGFNETDDTITDENGVWTYSGTVLTPQKAGDYALSNIWTEWNDLSDLDEYNNIRFGKSIMFRVSDGAEPDSFDWLEVNADHVKKTYKCGEMFDTTGLEVKGHFKGSSGVSYDRDLSDGEYRVISGKLTDGSRPVIIAYSAFGQTKTAAIPVTVDHDWDDGRVTKPATVSEEGEKTFSCSHCGEMRTEGISRLTPQDSSGGSVSSGVPQSSNTETASSGSENGSSASNEIRDSKLPKVDAKEVTAGRKSMTLSWKKLSGSKGKKIAGIEIQYSLKRSFPNEKKLTRRKVIRKTAGSAKIKNLRSKKTYWVRMRTFRKVNGVKHVGKWSAAKKIRIK